MDKSVRALFVSDVHLGTPNCQARYLLNLLSTVRTERLFLLGDVIDIQAISQRAYWSSSHSAVAHKILSLASAGVEVVYVPGNHDALLRRFDGQKISGVRFANRFEYVALDGSRYLLRHGDELDPTRQGKRWIESLGETLYESICWVNRWYNAARNSVNLEYTPLSVGLKRRVKQAMEFIHGFEDRAIAAAKRLPVDGYICGHVHHAAIRQEGGVAYLNDGDWVEHCTVLCEPQSGGFELWQWTERQRLLASLPPEWWRYDEPLPTAA